MSTVVASHANGIAPFSEKDPAPASESRSIVAIETLATITVPRDLAVQLIGSDAGHKRRQKPHAAMTKGATPAEIAAVEAFMKPFLDREIRRVEKTEKMIAQDHTAQATLEQAKALKAFCQRFAASLKAHLAAKGADDRHYRSKQRLDQALKLINQINSALNLPVDAVESIRERADDLFAQAMRLRNELHDYYEHCAKMIYRDPKGGTLPSPAPLLIELLQVMNSVMDDGQQSKDVE